MQAITTSEIVLYAIMTIFVLAFIVYLKTQPPIIGR